MQGKTYHVCGPKTLPAILSLVLTFSWIQLYAQNGIVKGTVSESDGVPLIGANVIIDAAAGLATISDENGNYQIAAPSGDYSIEFKYIGKQGTIKDISISNGQVVVLDIQLADKTELIDAIVITGSKFEKRQSEETVSIEVLKSDLIRDRNPLNIDEDLNKVPGVSIIDGQPNIRGGSGWSYGAGSRVQVLVDGLPILSADAADPKWDLVPTDNIQQVEVLKGAASALYGSSALNGIINIQTAFPGSEPETNISAYAGFFDKPPTREMAWWTGQGFDALPKVYGINLTHKRKIKRFDLVVGGYYSGEELYLMGKTDQKYRINTKMRYRPKKVQGLSFGVNTYLSTRESNTFFLWDGIDSSGYIPLPGSITNARNNRFAVDPFVTFIDKKQNKYTARGRYFNAANKANNGQGSIPVLYYGEGQYQRTFVKPNINFTAGVSGYYSDVRSPNEDPDSSLVGNHTGSNISLYAQADKKFFDRLNVSFGVRWEEFRIDTLSSNATPNIRIGMNYQAAEATFIRASFGQGYRFPTIAEKFVNTVVGSIGVYPNPNLEPEEGWSAEIGIKQGLKLGADWQGYIDLAGFINKYDNMMEFNFAQYGLFTDPFFGAGFSSQNVGDTRIVGGELVTAFTGELFGSPSNLILGYTFIDPVSLNWEDTLTTFNRVGDTLMNQTYASTSSSEENILKYRYRHQFKADFETSIKRKVQVGLTMLYNSFMENIDNVFIDGILVDLEETIPTSAFSGLAAWREQTDGRGDFIMDIRIGYLITPQMKISLIAKNVTNTAYTARPALFEPPRNFTIRYAYDF